MVEQHLRKETLLLSTFLTRVKWYIYENDNLSTGGVAIDVTDEVHEQNKNLALAAGIMGLDVAGLGC